VITISTLLLPVVAQADRWYQVEVLVFKHLEAVGVGGEEWLELEALPDFKTARELLADLPDMSDEPAPLDSDDLSSEVPMAFKLLDYPDRRLTELEDKLENSREYAPVLFSAWRQPPPKKKDETNRPNKIKLVHFSGRVSPVETTITEKTEAISVPPLEVEGFVTVRIGKYLHVDLDFVYYHEGQPVRLKESRRVKLRETHYFDHPLFGIIVELSPYALPEAIPEGGIVVSGGTLTLS